MFLCPFSCVTFLILTFRISDSQYEHQMSFSWVLHFLIDMLTVIMLIVIILSDVLLNAIMLNLLGYGQFTS
jgi:hypothetical protein